MKKLSLIVFRNSAFGLAAQMIIKILSFTFSIFVVRRLGVEIFGQYSAVLAFGMTFAFIGDLGLSPYLVREVARLRVTPNGWEKVEILYSNVLGLRILLSIVGALLTIIVAWLTHRPLIMIIGVSINSISLLLYGIHGSADSMLAGFERLDISSVAKVIFQLLFVVLGTVVMIFQVGYYGLLVVNVLGVGVMALVVYLSTRKLGLRVSIPSYHLWLGLLKACLPFGILALALGLSYKFDSVLLNIVRGDTETGLYNAAYNLVFSAVLISNVVNTALYPSLSRQSVGNPGSLPKIYEKVFHYLILISLPLAVGIWATADKLVPFLYSRSYQSSVVALKILIWVVPFMFASEFLGYIVTIENKERLVARSVVISTMINILANLFLIPHYGYIGASIMTLLTEMVLVGQYSFILRKQLVVMNWVRTLIRPLVSVFIMGLILFLLAPFLSLIALIATGAVIYFCFSVIFGAIGKDDLIFIRKLQPEPAAEAYLSKPGD